MDNTGGTGDFYYQVDNATNEVDKMDVAGSKEIDGCKLVIIDDKGTEIVKERILPIEQAENEVFDEMTAEEHEELLRLIKKYLDCFRCKVEKLRNDAEEFAE